MKSSEHSLKILPLGGLGEIGMNCMIFEYDDEIIVVDCGLMFSDLDHFGVQFTIPDFRYLLERKEKIKAIIITHGHEDHIGAIAFALKTGIDCPIYASTFSSLLLRERLKEHGLTNSADVRTFRMGDQIKFNHFKITTVSVNHSIVDAAALIIDTPIGKVIHTGDFKIDSTPFYGQSLDKSIFAKAGEEGVLLLMSDSTNVERHEHAPSESTIYHKFEMLFAAAQGLQIVSMFASNVGRMGQVFEVAKKLGKKIALSGRSMERNVGLGIEAGYLKDAQSIIISIDHINRHNRKDVIVLSTGSQGENASSLIRVAAGEHKQIQLQPGDQVIMSSKFIPGNEKAIGHMINALFKQGAEVLYESIHEIHVSGHATRPELQVMLELTKPKFFIPIHGEYRHLVHHSALAEDVGIHPENVVLAVNGDLIEVTRDSCEIIDHFEENRVLVDGREGNDITKLVLKERRHMAEKGIVFSLMVRNKDNQQIIAGPQIITKGVVNQDLEATLIEQAKKLVKKVAKDHDKEDGDLEETIRIELRRFFNSKLGTKPTVVPIILDV